jgi:hypothetical protein
MTCVLSSNFVNKVIEDFENLKINNVDKYIRIKLGQRTFPTPKMKECIYKNDNHYCRNCKNCKYNEWCFTWKKEGHLRFDFDARNITKNNFKIIQLFNEYFEDIKLVIHSYKNFIEGYFITPDDYIKYDYWGQSYNNIKFPCIATIELSGLGTVEIIKTIIERIKKINNGCQIPGNCGYKCDTLCDTCMIYENGITPSIFNFKLKKLSHFESMRFKYIFEYTFPKTTKKIEINDYENDIIIIIDCENNFTKDEKNVIYDYKITKLQDLMTDIRINNLEKINCLKYYKLITENYKLNGYDVFNETVSVQFNNYIINIIILHDGTIKYCSSSGEKIYID